MAGERGCRERGGNDADGGDVQEQRPGEQVRTAPGGGVKIGEIVFVVLLGNGLLARVFLMILETVQDNAVVEANLLIDKKALDISPLIPRQLDDLPHLLVHLHSPVAREVLLEGLANALDVEVVGKTGDGRDTLSAISLLDADVHLFGGGLPSLVLGRILEGVEGIELHFIVVRSRINRAVSIREYVVIIVVQMRRRLACGGDGVGTSEY